MRKITHDEVFVKCNTLADFLIDDVAEAGGVLQLITCYPVPRGGIPVAYALGEALLAKGVTLQIEDDPARADFVLDDLIDSGATRDKFKEKDPELPFYALFSKQDGGLDPDEWVVFPWEDDTTQGADDVPLRLLQYIGEQPGRGGLKETPARFLKAWKFWTKGYSENARDILKTFEDGAENCNEMVVVRDIPAYSKCEHHLADIFGVAHVAYIPDGKIVGLSKLNRLVDMFGRRLQVQERWTNQIADALEKHLKPKGIAVVIEARHMCIESRGIQHQGCKTTTSAMRGAMMEDPSARSEFLRLIGK